MWEFFFYPKSKFKLRGLENIVSVWDLGEGTASINKFGRLRARKNAFRKKLQSLGL